MFNNSMLAPRYDKREATTLLKNFDRRGILKLATDELSIPFHARATLRSNLIAKFDDLGLHSAPGFYDVLKHTGALISGSFVPAFLDEDFAQSWDGIYYGPRDVDVYVAKGKLQPFLTAMDDLQGSTMIIERTSERPTPVIDDDGNVHVGEQDDFLYNNTAIEKMARLRIESDSGDRCYMDILESISNSAFMPITKFSLSHLRQAISADGFYDLHPNWHADFKTFTSPRTSEPNDNNSSFVFFLNKYRERGYDVRSSGCVDDIKFHRCHVHTDCPLTLRSTIDDGVSFVPFTKEAAIRYASGPNDLLQNPIVYWKHGGRCVYDHGDAEDSLAYDSQGVNAQT